MGGDSRMDTSIGETTGLNPPRPHGRGLKDLKPYERNAKLKSTPPAWAGTMLTYQDLLAIGA